MTDLAKDRPEGTRKPAAADPMQMIAETLGKIRFGGIQLTVHEGRLVQIEVTEKHRFT